MKKVLFLVFFSSSVLCGQSRIKIVSVGLNQPFHKTLNHDRFNWPRKLPGSYYTRNVIDLGLSINSVGKVHKSRFYMNNGLELRLLTEKNKYYQALPGSNLLYFSTDLGYNFIRKEALNFSLVMRPLVELYGKNDIKDTETKRFIFNLGFFAHPLPNKIPFKIGIEYSLNPVIVKTVPEDNNRQFGLFNLRYRLSYLF